MNRKFFFLVLGVLFILGAQVCYAQDSAEGEDNLSKGYELFMEGFYEEAIECYNEYLKGDAPSPKAYLLRSYAYSELGDYEKVTRDLNLAVEHWNDSAGLPAYTPYFYRAEFNSMLERYEEAAADYGVVYEMVARDDDQELAINMLLQRGAMYCKLDEPDKADADYYLVLEKDSLNEDAILGIALNDFQRENYKEAVDFLNEKSAVGSFSHMMPVYKILGYVHMREVEPAIENILAFIEQYDGDRSLKEQLVYFKEFFIELDDNNRLGKLQEVLDAEIEKLDEKEKEAQTAKSLNEIRFGGWTHEDWIDNDYLRELRKAIDARVAGTDVEYPDDDIQQYKELIKDSKFVIGDLSESLLGGLDIYFIFYEAPNLLFNVWVYSEVDVATETVVGYSVRSIRLANDAFDSTKEEIDQFLKECPEYKLW